MEMTFNEMLGMLSLVGLLLAFVSGFPISFTMMFIGLAFGYLGIGKLVFYLMNIQFYQVMSDPVLGAIPFFLFMGYILESAGLMDNLFYSIQKLLAPVPGSLYLAIITTATIFAAATGIVGSSITLLCMMAGPAIARSRYDIRMGAGAMAAGGTLGILIPPSIMLVVMGPLMGVPVTDLFAGAVIPGILLSGIYVLYSLIRCFFWPEYGPPLDKELRAESIPALIVDLLKGVVPLILLIGATLGSILAGLATPTEASACGALGALLLVVCYGKFRWQNLKKAMYSTAKLSAMILIMIAASNFYGSVFSRLGGAGWLSNQLVSMSLPPMGMVILIMCLVFLLGWAMEWVPIVLIVLPIMMPTVKALGIDPLWFAIVYAVTLQTSWLTPPVALSCYFIKGCLPQWQLSDIYRGMFQYIACQAVGIALILMFPSIVTWLPSIIGK
ncbi:TRAP transporter, DctM subunit [Desulfacinum hydrothermale DSM 13146]|uniref:TRAP transporter, DctM subunit n=1 Tax=Desulfacinum hydrothermale DSM 13146 TaxID=1121390 RepID=A0A1W1XEJ8_9BACT|nr:TRAP transporter large permease subunit [Desulfacinum hydrothermale]SMC22068.1 TRAP transporter, DctM subunit [Desulfacinum hydrothermale DSM 13146]